MLNWLVNRAKTIYRAYLRLEKDDGLLMAAAVAYYLGLSLFPMLVVLLAGLGAFLEYTHMGEDARRQLLEIAGEQVSPRLRSDLDALLKQVSAQSAVSGPLGLIGILIAALAGFAQFERGFDRIWSLPEAPRQGVIAAVQDILWNRGSAFVLLLCFGLVVVVIFVASTVVSAMQSFAHEIVPVLDFLRRFIRVILSSALNVAIFTLLFRWLPKTIVTWEEAFRGALFTAIGWEIGRQILATAIVTARYSAYGAIGSFIVVLLWCFYATAVIFLAAEYIQETRGEALHSWRRKKPKNSTP